ncbi:hypothetical protein BJF78_28715 [Pseudonocardia sp. CNS-139]|nr:hypothetical protein BJF78_28715 [Pseudonocardia sp. CNS-139]
MAAPAAGRRALGRLQPVGWAVLAVGVGILASVATTGALAGSAPATLVGASVTRTGMDVAGVGCAGTTLLLLLLPRPAVLPGSAVGDLRRVRASADRAVVALAGAWLILALLAIAFRTADASAGPSPSSWAAISSGG